jgi:hypothetical protein
MKVKKQNPFEFIFHDFVTDFGGEVLPEAPDGHTADYLFPKHNIIAELKSLTVDQTEDMNQKLTPAVMEWIKKSGRKPVGVVGGDKYVVEIKDMPPEIQDVWLKWLKAPADILIRDANRQIRDTKERLRLLSAKGLILIANEANVYHNHPEDYKRLIVEILRKRTPQGDLRFPHIHAAVYFSVKDVKSRDQGMYFWANLQMRQTPDEDMTPMAEFQKELQQAWYRYIEKVCQIEVRRHSGPVGSPS